MTYPHTIENGAGESLTFVRRRATPTGEVLEVENCVGPGSGPPMHVHHFQDEALTVERGRIAYQILGEEAQFAGAGETVTFAAGIPHRFWNPGAEELRCTGYVRPPDNIEFFLGSIYESQRQSGGHRPDPFDAAYLTWRYRSEFEMVEIPAFVRTFVIPIQVAIGTMLGKYRKYRDAPPPVVRGTRESGTRAGSGHASGVSAG